MTVMMGNIGMWVAPLAAATKSGLNANRANPKIPATLEIFVVRNRNIRKAAKRFRKTKTKMSYKFKEKVIRKTKTKETICGA